MKTIKLSIIINAFFIFITALLFFYAVFFYNDNGFLISILLSSLIAIISSGVYVSIAALKGEIVENKYGAESLLNSFNYFLFLKSKSEILKLLEDYYLSIKVKTTILENSLLIPKTSTQIFPLIKPEKITLSEIIEIRKNVNSTNKVIVLGVDFSEDISKIIKRLNLDISLIRTSDFLSALNEKNLLPKIEIVSESKPKLNARSFLKKVFSKTNAKKFFLAGILLSIMSFFTFYPTYYLILGTSLMITSVILRLKEDKKTPSKNALDNIVEK